MYCKKCGKEISDGAGFCKFCGGRVKADTSLPTGSGALAQMPLAPLPAAEQKETQPKKLPISIAALGPALAALVVVVIAAGLIFARGGNKIEQEIRQAKKYLEEGNYEEALGCCEKVLEKDRRYAEAYLVCADIHIAREAYKDAIEILDEYLEPANEEELKEFKENFDEKREEVYRIQEEALSGVWQMNYDIENLIPKDFSGSYSIPVEPVPILLEFNGDGGLYLSIEPDYFDGARQILSKFATVATTAATQNPIRGKAAGWITNLVTGLLADNAGVSYSYNVVEDRLYCTNAEGEKEFYLFEINGGTLTVQSCSEEKYYLDFPLVLERTEQQPDAAR